MESATNVGVNVPKAKNSEVSNNKEESSGIQGLWGRFKVSPRNSFCVLGGVLASVMMYQNFDLKIILRNVGVLIPVIFTTYRIFEYIAETSRKPLVLFDPNDVRIKDWGVQLRTLCVDMGGEIGVQFSDDKLQSLYMRAPSLRDGLTPEIHLALVAEWLDNKTELFSDNFFGNVMLHYERHKDKAFAFTILDSFKDMGYIIKADKKTLKKYIGSKDIVVMDVSEFHASNGGADIDRFSKLNYSHTHIGLFKDSNGVVLREDPVNAIVEQMDQSDRAFVVFSKSGKIRPNIFGFRVDE